MIGLGSLIGLILILVLFVFTASNNRLNRSYQFDITGIELPSDSLAIERGRHIAITRGCMDCHGINLGGSVVMDNPAMGYMAGPNLTYGKGGLPASYSDLDYIRAIRHGISPEGRALVLMPSEEYYYLGDEDLGSLIAYLKSIPPFDRDLGDARVGPVARLLIAFRQAPLISAELIEHEGVHPEAPQVGITVEYGKYLSASCIGCHGAGFSGGKIPVGPPNWPPATNLTPDVDTGMGTWSEADFIHSMRYGIRPDGTVLDPIMPWPNFGQMTDTELKALWMYLSQVPSKKEGNR